MAKRQEIKKVGIAVENPPSQSCNDKKCPFHGSVKLRGRIFTGKVLASRAQKTAKVGWERMYYLPKFERYERRRTRLHVHNPSCINAEDNDIVRIAETRPLSKTKNFVIIEKLRKEITIIGEDTGIKEKEKEAIKKEIKEEMNEGIKGEKRMRKKMERKEKEKNSIRGK